MAPRSGLVLLPDSSGLRDRVTAALLGSDVALWPAAQLAEAGYVLVDLTSPMGEEALRSLTPVATQQAVLAVVDQSVLRRRSVVSVPADSLLAVGQLESELGWRLQKARERHALEIQSRTQQRSLEALLELTARYAESTDVDALLHDVTRRLAEMLDIPRASLLLDDGAGSAVVVAASDAPDIKNLRIEMARYPEVRQCLRTGLPTVVEDVPSHPLLEGMHERVVAAGVRSIAALPLTRAGQGAGRAPGPRLGRASSLHPRRGGLPRDGGPRHRGRAAERASARERARRVRAREVRPPRRRAEGARSSSATRPSSPTSPRASPSSTGRERCSS